MRRIKLLICLARIYKDIHPKKSEFRFLKKAFWLPTTELERVYDAMQFQDGIVNGGMI